MAESKSLEEDQEFHLVLTAWHGKISEKHVCAFLVQRKGVSTANTHPLRICIAYILS